MAPNSTYDLHSDAKLLALVAEKAQAEVVNDKVVLIFNFFELNPLLPVKN